MSTSEIDASQEMEEFKKLLAEFEPPSPREAAQAGMEALRQLAKDLTLLAIQDTDVPLAEGEPDLDVEDSDSSSEMVEGPREENRTQNSPVDCFESFSDDVTAEELEELRELAKTLERLSQEDDAFYHVSPGEDDEHEQSTDDEESGTTFEDWEEEISSEESSGATKGSGSSADRLSDESN